jgi:MFS transporter, CP family, cyanate transporter
MLGFAGKLATRPSAYFATGFVCLVSFLGIALMDARWIVFWSAMIGFAEAITLILVLALPSILSAPDDVHRTSAAMFTVSYSCAMVISVLGGWLWDLTHLPIAWLAPVALCEVAIIVLAPSVRRAE